MKYISILLPCLFLISCASTKYNRVIQESEYDGLRFESLKRFDKTRIQQKTTVTALCHQEKYDQAFEQLTSHLDQKTNDFSYWNDISTCYLLQKNYTRARHFLDIALSKTKSNKQKSVVLNNLGVTYLENQKFTKAKEYFKNSIALDHNALTPRFNITQIYVQFGLYKKAQKELSFLLTKSPKDVDFLTSMGHLKLMQGKYKTALNIFQSIPPSYQVRDDIATNLAMTYLMLGKYHQSEIAINQAKKEDKTYASAQANIIKSIEKAQGK